MVELVDVGLKIRKQYLESSSLFAHQNMNLNKTNSLVDLYFEKFEKINGKNHF